MRNKNSATRDTLTISQLNRQAKRLLESNFASVWVEGEISNLARPSSGHWYFSLKDSSAQVRCAMFRSANARVRFNVEAGQQVMARAKLSLYEARGDYQLLVEHLEPAGDGALAKAFEALKLKLSEQGLFDPQLKKPLPAMIRHIAVVTSTTGAAIRDILTVLARRFPATQVTIFPTQVQGQQAAPQIVRAIDNANRLCSNNHANCDFDAILVSRGGGSLEDLWPFNEEMVALSIANSELPVVSAVGHEIDFTIADFVADIRAATPSAAAELLSPDQREWLDTLAGYEQLLEKQIKLIISDLKRQLEWQRSRLKHPGNRLQEHAQRLDDLEMRLKKAWQQRLLRLQHQLDLHNARLKQQTPLHSIEQLKLNLSNISQRMQQLMLHKVEHSKTRLKTTMHLLNTVSPLATLERGYAIATDENNQVISDASTVTSGQTVMIRLAKGRITSTVKSVSQS